MTSRKEALARGALRYFGKVCEQHPELKGERRTASGNCLKCKQAAIRRWHKANPEVHKRKVRKWRTLHREKYLEGALTRNARGLVRRQAAASKATAATRRAYATLLRKAKRLGLTVDHIVPIAGCRVCGAKGRHEPSNWQLLTARENARKGNQCGPCSTARLLLCKR